MYGGYSMNMKKLLLSLLIVAGLMNFTHCLAEEKVLSPRMLFINDVLDYYNTLVTSEMFREFEKKQSALEEVNSNFMNFYNICNAQNNCDELFDFQLLLDQAAQAETQRNEALSEVAKVTGIAQEDILKILLTERFKK